jgi:septal ring factor EnvC (AmiA/AmiB activator)
MMRVFVVIAILIISFPLWAGDETQDLDKIRTDIDDVNQSMEQIEGERGDVSQQLRTLEKEYGKAANSLRSLSKNINTKWRRLKEINREIKSRQAVLKAESHQLEGQIKATFIMGQKEKLKLLLNQQDPKLASRMLMYHRYLNDARLARVIAIKEQISTLMALREEKKQQSTQLKQNSSSKKRQQKKLIKTRNKRQVLLVKLNNDFTLKAQQLTHLKSNEKQLEELLVSLGKTKVLKKSPSVIDKLKTSLEKPAKINLKTSTAFFKQQQGTFSWPVKGKILKQFNSERPGGRWDGVLISAEEGTNIKAIAKGEVIYADWLRGYGLLVIIDHGADYMSLYAFNQSIGKKVGDHIKAGSIIAAVGKSGGRDEIGLYFGIRHKGKSINPAHWCQKIQNGYVG